MNADVLEIARCAIGRNASDIYLTEGQRMFFREEGHLVPQSEGPCSAEDISSCLGSLLTEGQKQKLETMRDLDFSWEAHGRRFRGNAYFQQGRPALVLRLLSSHIFSFGQIGAEKALHRLLQAANGLVLVTGKVGSGKSTTIAAYIEEINRYRPAHVITLEDPVEYVYRPKKCFISQRELGVDFLSFPQGLRSALREMPDVIVVGELRDPETMQTALMAAETGILVLGTLHTKSAAETAMRVEGMFPAGQRDAIRDQFAAVFTGILSQELLPAVGGGRVSAVEALLATTAARNLVRQGKYHQLPSVMMSGREEGMQTREMAWKDLWQKGLIAKETLGAYRENF